MNATIQNPVTIGTYVPVEASSPPEPPAKPDPLLTEEELANHLKVCKRQLYNWRMYGVIPYLKLGRSVRYRLSDVERVLETLTIPENH